MRAAAIVTGVLGAGTVAVFALAALVSTLFPSGTLVPTSWNGGWGKPGVPMPVPMPLPVPGIDGGGEKGVIVRDDGSVVTVGDPVPPDVAPQP